MQLKNALFGSLLILLGAGANELVVRAGVVSFVTDDTPIPDGNSGGLTWTLAQGPPITSVSEIAVRLSHESLGDLIVRVIPPAGPAFTLFERVGVTPSTPAGSAAVLGAYVLNGVDQATLVPQAYRFAPTGLSLETEAQSAWDNSLIPVVPWDTVYAAKSWNDGPFPAGTWTLQLIDASGLSVGTVNAAELQVTSAAVVPDQSVSTFCLLSVALTGLAFGKGMVRKF